MLKKIILINALFSFYFCFGQKNFIKGIGYGTFPLENPSYYYISVAYERMIYKKTSLQLTYACPYWKTEGDYIKYKKIVPEFRYYLYQNSKKINLYMMLFDEYLSCHKDFSYEVHYEDNYYLNGIGFGCGTKVKILKRFFFDFNISARHYYHFNSEDALDVYYATWSGNPSIFNRVGIRTSLFFGFILF